MQSNYVSAAVQQTKVSHKPSITGFVLAILSLILSGIGNLIIRAAYAPTGQLTGGVDHKVGQVIEKGTEGFLGTVFGFWFIVGGILFALISFIFILFRLRKVRVPGLIFSLAALALIAWSVCIAVGAFDLMKAKP